MMMKLKERVGGKKNLIRLLVAATALLILIVAAVYTVLIKPSLNKEQYIYMEKTVEKGDLILGIMETGNISLQTTSIAYQIDLTSEEDSSEEEDDTDLEEEETIKYLEIEEVYAVAGQRIAEGDKLFKLTQESVEAVEKRLDTQYTEAQIALAEARTEYEIELLQAKSTYDTSMLEAERADSSYQASTTKTREGLNRLSAQIQILEAEITDYKEQLEDEELWESLEQAQTAYTAAEELYQKTEFYNSTAYVSNYQDWQNAKQQLESIQNQIESLETAIEENQQQIADKQQEIQDVQNAMEIENLTNESSYEAARLGGELAESIYNYTVSSLEESVAVAEADMEEQENNREEFYKFVGQDGIIYADGGGLVTSVLYGEGDSLIQTGEILSYVKEDAYEVTIDVSEEDISAVSIGDSVDIELVAYPDGAYTGTVTSITTTANSDYAVTVSYPVTIRIEGDTTLLYGGMTTNVTFVTDSVSDVLYVSKKAVKEMDGKSYVYRKETGGGKKLVEVETGFSDGTNIEIKSGLSEGDTIYIESRISGSQAELMQSGQEERSGSQMGDGESNPIGNGTMESMPMGGSMEDMPMGGGSMDGNPMGGMGGGSGRGNSGGGPMGMGSQ